MTHESVRSSAFPSAPLCAPCPATPRTACHAAIIGYPIMRYSIRSRGARKPKREGAAPPFKLCMLRAQACVRRGAAAASRFKHRSAASKIGAAALVPATLLAMQARSLRWKRAELRHRAVGSFTASRAQPHQDHACSAAGSAPQHSFVSLQSMGKRKRVLPPRQPCSELMHSQRRDPWSASRDTLARQRITTLRCAMLCWYPHA